MIHRYSSRREKLKDSFINEKLKNAVSYDRIAGYFSSSLIEVAGEALGLVRDGVRIICNSDIDISDFQGIKSAIHAQKISWTKNDDVFKNQGVKDRFQRLSEFIISKKIQIKILPDEAFGLVHGKAGVIGYVDGKKTAFIGSVNESYRAWCVNYEILWEDNSDEGIRWVEEEFNALWNHPLSCNLSDFVVDDMSRLSKRIDININDWSKEIEKQPDSAMVELPVNRNSYGLMPHQKYFINLAYKAHKKKGARYILADQVGLGKTVQLAAAAMLMSLYGDKPVLILAPKSLLYQWQTEIKDMLGIPSAVWTSKGWVDENNILYPLSGHENIKKCPRRIGIVS